MIPSEIAAQIRVLVEVQRWFQSKYKGRPLATISDYATDHSWASEVVTYLDDKIAALKIEAKKRPVQRMTYLEAAE
jgi:beta-N-acetylglucosaminidase